MLPVRRHNQKRQMNTFKELINQIFPGAQGTDRIWDFLCSCYCQPWRRYHTFNHINNFIALFEETKKLLREPSVVEIAIWYHDCVYIPGSRLNEKMSAQIAFHNLKFLNPKNDLGIFVKGIIEERPDPRLRSDWKYFRDMDYSIIAQEPQVYNQYVRDIYLEYRSVYSKKDIKEGREIFLRKLSLRKIFLTEYFWDLYNQKAKENIFRELSDSEKITKGIE